MNQQSPQIIFKNILDSQFHSLLWLSLRTNISTQKLIEFENGDSIANPTELQKIAYTLNVSADEIIIRN